LSVVAALLLIAFLAALARKTALTEDAIAEFEGAEEELDRWGS